MNSDPNSVVSTLLRRNEVFAAKDFVPDLKIMPSLKTMIIGCVDPRVDPLEIFGLQPGEVATIRNVGGRIFPSTLETMGMLRLVSRAKGGDVGAGWNLVVLHHTDCGINCLAQAPELAKHFGIDAAGLEVRAITDPRASVAQDVAALKANPKLPGALLVSGLVYDVATGRVETIVATQPLRIDAPA
jgi:carbonic anhydrase